MTITTADIIYKEVAGMNHGSRPCVVIGITGEWAHIVPLSSSGRPGQPYVKTSNQDTAGYAAPNRYHKVKASGLEAWATISEEDAGRVWDSVWG